MKISKNSFKILLLIFIVIVLLFFYLYLNSFYINNNGIYNSKNKLNYFESKEQLEKWLFYDYTDSLCYIDKQFDCDDFALLLQRNAFNDGYIISCQYIYENNSYHIINNVFIPLENKIYCVEPQTDKIYMLCFID